MCSTDFLVVSLVSTLHDQDVKHPNATFHGGHEHTTTGFSSLSAEVGRGAQEFNCRENHLHLAF